MTLHAPKFVLHVTALPTFRDPSGLHRLRGALKSLLRVWRLRCTRIEYPDIPAEIPTAGKAKAVSTGFAEQPDPAQTADAEPT